MSREYQLDELAQDAALHLLEKFWIIRETQPELYFAVKDRERMLKKFFTEKLGYQLIIHRFFVRLIKIPGEVEPWMGIQDFKASKDYVLLCCLLAFLEEKGTEEQFLLSEMVEAIQVMYPGKEAVDWTQYEDRKSLVRVLKLAREIEIILAIEGEESIFSLSTEGEVLYENTPQSRYFMRMLPRELSTSQGEQDILESEWLNDEEDRGLRRRHRVYRRIFLSPVLYPMGADDQDFLYIKNYRNIIKQDIESNFPATFELYRDLALMVYTERKQIFTFFPDTKNITEIVMQLGGMLREKIEGEELLPDQWGRIVLTPLELERLIRDCREQFGVGWNKGNREMSFSGLVQAILDHLIYWNMAQVDLELDCIYLLPLVAKFAATYPDDFEKEDRLDDDE